MSVFVFSFKINSTKVLITMIRTITLPSLRDPYRSKYYISWYECATRQNKAFTFELQNVLPYKQTIVL